MAAAVHTHSKDAHYTTAPQPVIELRECFGRSGSAAAARECWKTAVEGLFAALVLAVSVAHKKRERIEEGRHLYAARRDQDASSPPPVSLLNTLLASKLKGTCSATWADPSKARRALHSIEFEVHATCYRGSPADATETSRRIRRRQR
jgi:hypothetical protein